MSVAPKNRLSWRAALLLGACLISGGKPTSFAMPADQKPLTIRESNNNSVLILPKSRILVVRLGVTPGTGFSWHLTRFDRSHLKLLGGPAFEASEEAKPGANEEQAFRFEAVAAGRSVLSFGYRRGWEKDAQPAKIFKITVKTE